MFHTPAPDWFSAEGQSSSRANFKRYRDSRGEDDSEDERSEMVVAGSSRRLRAESESLFEEGDGGTKRKQTRIGGDQLVPTLQELEVSGGSEEGLEDETGLTPLDYFFRSGRKKYVRKIDQVVDRLLVGRALMRRRMGDSAILDLSEDGFPSYHPRGVNPMQDRPLLSRPGSRHDDEGNGCKMLRGELTHTEWGMVEVSALVANFEDMLPDPVDGVSTFPHQDDDDDEEGLVIPTSPRLPGSQHSVNSNMMELDV